MPQKPYSVMRKIPDTNKSLTKQYLDAIEFEVACTFDLQVYCLKSLQYDPCRIRS